MADGEGPARLGALLRATGYLADDGLPTGAVVPVGEGPYDDCFVDVVWPVTLRWPGALTLCVDSDAGYVVVFDEKDAAVCVEPQTAPPDAARLGRARVVEPGSPSVLTTTWAWTRPGPREAGQSSSSTVPIA
jgi:aldose 1-epimerase